MAASCARLATIVSGCLGAGGLAVVRPDNPRDNTGGKTR